MLGYALLKRLLEVNRSTLGNYAKGRGQPKTVSYAVERREIEPGILPSALGTKGLLGSGPQYIYMAAEARRFVGKYDSFPCI
jgi:hypothetical protein